MEFTPTTTYAMKNNLNAFAKRSYNFSKQVSYFLHFRYIGLHTFFLRQEYFI